MKMNLLLVIMLSAVMLTTRACPVPPTDPSPIPSVRSNAPAVMQETRRKPAGDQENRRYLGLFFLKNTSCSLQLL
jgi:hypothetical protein